MKGPNVEAPPVDSSLTRGFRAGRMPFPSYGVSVSYAQLMEAVMCAALCAPLSVCSFLACLWA